MRASTLLLMAIGATAPFLAQSQAQAACDPTIKVSPTKYPLQSQLRGQKGIVFVEVTVDASGRVTNTQLVQSSGYRRLDRAATASIRDGWHFDVTRCAHTALPAKDVVAVEYRNEEFGQSLMAKSRQRNHKEELSASTTRAQLVRVDAKK